MVDGSKDLKAKEHDKKFESVDHRGYFRRFYQTKFERAYCK